VTSCSRVKAEAKVKVKVRVKVEGVLIVFSLSC
jgi:hypothetical protein